MIVRISRTAFAAGIVVSGLAMLTGCEGPGVLAEVLGEPRPTLGATAPRDTRDAEYVEASSSPRRRAAVAGRVTARPSAENQTITRRPARSVQSSGRVRQSVLSPQADRSAAARDNQVRAAPAEPAHNEVEVTSEQEAGRPPPASEPARRVIESGLSVDERQKEHEARIEALRQRIRKQLRQYENRKAAP